MKRAILPCMLLSFSVPVLCAQAPADSASPALAWIDRYVVDAAKLVRETGARTLAELLAGRVPGLLVVEGSGLNGGGSRIRFAGPRSLIDDAAPLVLVDGMRVHAAEDASLIDLGGPGPTRLEDMNPEEIESIEVLRGPASGAIYGPGASAGVILIRTKAGRSGPPRWETFADATLGAVPSHWPANYGGVDADNANPAMRLGGCTLTAQAEGRCTQDFVQSFNPFEQRSPFATVLRRHAGFSGSGGPRWGAFRLTGAFDGDDGAYAVPRFIPENRYRRWNLRGSGTIRPLAALEIGLTLGRMSGDLRLPSYRPVRAALFGPSDSTAFSWDALFPEPGTQEVERTSGTVEIRATPLAWLAITGLVGHDEADQREVIGDPGAPGFAARRWVRNRTSMMSVSMNRSLRPGLRSETTVGVERLSRRLNEDERIGSAFESLRLSTRSLGAYVRQQVSIHDRVGLTGALRHDRFEEFDMNATHPSVAIAWLARPETTGLLGRLELRAAYGSAGQAPPADALLCCYVISPLPVEWPPLSPERTRSFEVGADARLFSGRWGAQVTLYDDRSDVTSRVPISTGTGFASGSEISNRGVQATLAGTLLDRPGLGWDLRLTVWGNRNRVVTLNSPPVAIGNQVFLPRYPVGGYWASPIRSYADANGDGIIAPSEVVVDSTWSWAGTPYPTQGAMLTSTWRVAGRWRFAGTLDYRAGHHLFNQARLRRCGSRVNTICRERHDPRTPLGDQAIAVAADFFLFDVPTAYIEDADYLKLRELWLTFDVPIGTAAALGARAATITLAGRNLFTWSGYSGSDPEAGSYGVSASGQPRAIADSGTLPPLRSWSLHLRLTY